MRKATILILAVLLVCLPDVSDARGRGRVDSRVNARVFGPDWSEIVLDLTTSATVDKFLAKYGGSFTRASDQYVFDYDGVLQQVSTNEIAIRGARLSGGEWYDTDASGNPLSSVSGFAVWPSETNSMASDEYRGSGVTNWDNNSAGLTGVTETSIIGVAGIDGTNDKAIRLGDDDASSGVSAMDSEACSAVGTWDSFSVYLDKDADETRFPAVGLRFTGGAAVQEVIVAVNSKTGAYQVVASGVTDTYYDVGVEHIVDNSGTTVTLRPWIAMRNTQAATQALKMLVPAHGTVLGTASDAATGTAIYDWNQYEKNRPRPTAPIVGGQTRAVNDLHFPNDGLIEDSRGAVYVEVEMSPEWFYNDTAFGIVSLKAGNYPLYHDKDALSLRSFDGLDATTSTYTDTQGAKKIASWWDNSSINILVNGTGYDTDTHGGAFDESEDIEIGYIGTSDNMFHGFIRRVEFWPKHPKNQSFWENYTD